MATGARGWDEDATGGQGWVQDWGLGLGAAVMCVVEPGLELNHRLPFPRCGLGIVI